MPELPEVETVKNQLSPYVIGRCITGITLLWDKIVKAPSPQEFISRTAGQKITGIERHGKYLIISLSSGDKLIIHLKMTGSLLLGKEGEPAPKYTRAVIHFDNSVVIFFRDPRKFGVLKLIKDIGEIDSKLGPEPLEDDFTLSIFSNRLENHKAPIKALLLDQKFLAGVGNMYADEALFKAKIHPERASNSLKKPEIERLYHAVRKVLMAGIEYGGASIVTYFHPDGSAGTAHQHFNVAHGQKKDCPACGCPIGRIVVRGRGTYYCPKCQK
ncbi:MAG: bifunctional DNA-formamidopyrimidine glycosylase/DNA-(apurinic or apyrimidinic site) lyase [Dehalococcoidales bacterium]|nr:bifunctional DNA-formamidopyrimidine glycosylase/DNA-(apurinic or apyrimidinic site) lyase [Dehalococcoidales bacterium]